MSLLSLYALPSHWNQIIFQVSSSLHVRDRQLYRPSDNDNFITAYYGERKFTLKIMPHPHKHEGYFDNLFLMNWEWPLILRHLRTKIMVLFPYHFWADIIGCSQYSVCTLVRGRHHFTDSKVSDFDYTFLCKKYVRRFQIPTKRKTVRIHSYCLYDNIERILENNSLW